MELRGGLKKCGVVADLHLPSRAVWIVDPSGGFAEMASMGNRRVKTGGDKVAVGQDEKEHGGGR